MTQVDSITLVELSDRDHDDWIAMVNDYDPDLTPTKLNVAWKNLKRQHSAGYLIQVAGSSVGFLHLTYHPFVFADRTCYLSDLYVKPEFRRRGVAREVLTLLVDKFKLAGWDRLYWITEYDNPIRSLYDSIAKTEFVRYHIDSKE